MGSLGMKSFCTFLWLFSCIYESQTVEVVYAINAGGGEHVDVHGIHYDADPLHNKIGIASSYGMNLLIARIPQNDQILYQTERYHHSTFGYDIPVKEDGSYLLILKFSEVYFKAPGEKVFDVALNRKHTVVPQLDIFDNVGFGVAHDEYIEFTIKDGKLIYYDEESEVHNGKIRIDFVKGYKDNPKVNAIVLLKSTENGKMTLLLRNLSGILDRSLLEDIPKLPSIPEAEEESVELQDDQQQYSNPEKPRRIGASRQPNPYSTHNSYMFIPILVTLAAFIPLVICLCKM